MTAAHEMRLRDLLDVLYRRRSVIAWIFTTVLGVGTAVSLNLPPVYRASATVASEGFAPGVVLDQTVSGLRASAGDTTGVPPDVSTAAELAKSETVREGVVVRLTHARGERAARAALKGLRVDPVRNTDLLRIIITAGSPGIAAEAANAVAASLIDMDLDYRRRQATRMRQFIEQQLMTLAPKLQASEDALTAFQSQHGDVALHDQTVLILNRLGQLEAQGVDVRLQRQEVQARIAAGRDRLSRQAQIAPTQWVPSPLVSSLEDRLATEEIELSGLRSQFTPKHPAVLNVESKIQETRRRLDVELGRSLQADQFGVDPVYQQLIQQLRQDEVANAALEARDRTLTGAIEEYETRLRQLPGRELQQARLARATLQAAEIHRILSEKLQQAYITEASIGSGLRIVDVARKPDSPVRSRRLGMLIGGVLGLIAGVGGAVIKEQLHDPIKSPEDAEDLLRLPVLSAIPRALGGGRRRAERYRTEFVEAFRYLRTNLLCLHQKPPRTLLVTSPRPGEGADIVAANLSIAFALLGRRVWLVECDLQKPVLDRVSAFRDVPSEGLGGLAEFLVEDLPITQVLHRTAVQNLWFLPAGTPPPNPAELLAGEKMRAFLNQNHDGADMLVLLPPPVLAVADAAALASIADGVVLVVRVGTTPREDVYRARQRLEAVGARLVGVVATDAPASVHRRYGPSRVVYSRAEPSGAWDFGPNQDSLQDNPRTTDAFQPSNRIPSQPCAAVPPSIKKGESLDHV